MNTLRENYEDYDRVKKAFKAFVHALVWESIDIDDGVHEDEVNKHIDGYCSTMGDGIIHDVNKSVTKYVKSFTERYSIHCDELNDNGDVIKSQSKHFNTNNVVIAFKSAAEFYRNAKRPLIKIYDNEIDKYIADFY